MTDASPGSALDFTMPAEQDPDLAVPAPAGPQPELRGSFPRTVPGPAERVPGTVAGSLWGTIPQAAGVSLGPGRERLVAGSVVPALAAPRQKITAAQQFLLLLRAGLSRFIANRRRRRSLAAVMWRDFYEEPADSLDGQLRYLGSLQWLRAYMTGWVRAFCKWENIAFGVLVSCTVTAVLGTVIKICQRQSRFWRLVFFAGLAFIVYRITHQ